VARRLPHHELARLDTLPRDGEYSGSDHTETYADAYNAVRVASMDVTGSEGP